MHHPLLSTLQLGVQAILNHQESTNTPNSIKRNFNISLITRPTYPDTPNTLPLNPNRQTPRHCGNLPPTRNRQLGLYLLGDAARFDPVGRSREGFVGGRFEGQKVGAVHGEGGLDAAGGRGDDDVYGGFQPISDTDAFGEDAQGRRVRERSDGAGGGAHRSCWGWDRRREQWGELRLEGEISAAINFSSPKPSETPDGRNA
jgi:hypothetical protein